MSFSHFVEKKVLLLPPPHSRMRERVRWACYISLPTLLLLPLLLLLSDLQLRRLTAAIAAYSTTHTWVRERERERSKSEKTEDPSLYRFSYTCHNVLCLSVFKFSPNDCYKTVLFMLLSLRPVCLKKYFYISLAFCSGFFKANTLICGCLVALSILVLNVSFSLWPGQFLWLIWTCVQIFVAKKWLGSRN